MIFVSYKRRILRTVGILAVVLSFVVLASCAQSSVSSMESSPKPSPIEATESTSVSTDGFVCVTDIVPDAILEMRYYGTYNFVGTRIDGYESPIALLTVEAAEALKLASDDLRAQGYTVKIFDAYRPQMAVDHFVKWASDESDTLMKNYFYPNLAKNKIIPDGYVASRSGHSRGSTIDLTIVDMKSGAEVDMGSPFDFFGPISGHGANSVTKKQAANRNILKGAMLRAGFKPYSKEWWHYTLKDEPYPDTYFTFPVK